MRTSQKLDKDVWLSNAIQKLNHLQIDLLSASQIPVTSGIQIPTVAKS